MGLCHQNERMTHTVNCGSGIQKVLRVPENECFFSSSTFCSALILTEDTPVPVANCNAKEYNANPKQIMAFREFLQYWREYVQNGHSSPRGCLYLKDWHMQR